MKKLLLHLVLSASLFHPFTSHAYSVLTHEAIVDALWQKTIVPLLKQKYPHAGEEDLTKAKAYAYGGAVAPDMGYYPFGSKLFTNLVHYVRSGDFVRALIDEEHNLNEYAFALGALCHYMADAYGHPLGINKSVPIVYPKVAKKYGHVVTYAQDKYSHLRMEFGFDVLQTARGSYAPKDYHDYIGFAVADTLLQQAFRETYGLDMRNVFADLSLAIGSFRWTVKNLFPEITKAAWTMKKGEIRKTKPMARSRDFIYRMRRKEYNKEFDGKRQKPGFLSSVLSFIIRVMPKVGPLKALKFKTPGPEAEKLFVQSFDTVVYHYVTLVNDHSLQSIVLLNKDYDTGKKTGFGEYPLCDETYKELLLRLKKNDFVALSAALKQNILGFYSKATILSAEKKEQQEINGALAALKHASTLN